MYDQLKKIKFEKLGVSNYCLFQDEIILDFKDNSIVVIYGANGKGKTSLFDAIPYTLYGVTSKGQKGPDVVNNIIGKNCHTWLNFKIDDVPYKIDRFYEHSKYKNDVHFYRGNELVKRGHNEVRQEIEKLLIPQKLFSNTIFFSQKIKTFFTDLNDSDQKEIFRKVLGLDEYELYKNECDNQLKLLENKIDTIKNKISICENILKDSEENIEKISLKKELFYNNKKERISEIENIIFSLKNKIQELEKEETKLDVEKTISYIQLANSEIEKTEREISILENKVFEFNSRIDEQKKSKKLEIENVASIRKIDLEKEKNINLNIIKEKYSRKTKEKSEKFERILKTHLGPKNAEILILNNKIETLTREKEKIENSIKKEGSICPECKQIISGEIIEKFKQDIQNIINNINDNILKKSKIKKKISIISEFLENTKNKISQEIEKQEYEIQEFSNEFDKKFLEIDERKKELYEKINEMIDKQKNEFTEKIFLEKKNLDEKKEEIKNKNMKYKKIYSDQIEPLKRDLENKRLELKLKINELEKTKTEEFDDSIIETFVQKKYKIGSDLKLFEESLDKGFKKFKILSFWKQGFSSSGIPSMLIDEAIPFMNERISEYLYEISNGRYIVSFDTLKATKKGEFKDKISVNVYDSYTQADTRNKLSGGQIRLIDISTILTLYDLQENYQNTSFNLFVMDEIFDAVDEENISSVCRVLKKISETKSIYIITHKHLDQIPADEILSF